MFQVDRNDLTKTGRVYFGEWASLLLDRLEASLIHLYSERFINPVQHGRVIAIRSTDTDRVFSAFKAALYLSKYDDMDNRGRFLNNMVKAGHSYEPIRGESIMFLFIGVGKPVYDHLITYSVGRTGRIAGGQRANLPWGYEVPVEAKQRDIYVQAAMPLIRKAAELTSRDGDTPSEQLQAARSLLPVGYIMPPFLLEFSEEALAKHIFPQRLWQAGAQGATVDVVNDMWQCCLEIDRVKWETLYDYHGPHIQAWEKAMRTLRDKNLSLWQILEWNGVEDKLNANILDLPLYEMIMATAGKLPPTMWERLNK
ncbi:hypothetical protein [Brevibacillus reuszeri]|uniref:hypothetical protein n=1 Tax=Brevibacillus reuszeri TaxID=54915 RepID=UPI000CCC6D72|nr:hypothetical protein [Brevibacillus reuszeri]